MIVVAVGGITVSGGEAPLMSAAAVFGCGSCGAMDLSLRGVSCVLIRSARFLLYGVLLASTAYDRSSSLFVTVALSHVFLTSQRNVGLGLSPLTLMGCYGEPTEPRMGPAHQVSLCVATF